MLSGEELNRISPIFKRQSKSSCCESYCAGLFDFCFLFCCELVTPFFLTSFTADCPPGTFGGSCDSTCQCQNQAACHNVNGSCTCTAGWNGTLCDTRKDFSQRYSYERPPRFTLRSVIPRSHPRTLA